MKSSLVEKILQFARKAPDPSDEMDLQDESAIAVIMKPVLVVLLVAFILGFLILQPQATKISDLEEKSELLVGLENELVVLEEQLENLEAQIATRKRAASKAQRFFYSSTELDKLFGVLAQLADKASVTVISFSKGDPAPVFSEDQRGSRDAEALYYQRETDLVVEADFRRYLEFRRRVGALEQVVDTSSEIIRVDEVSDAGRVLATVKVRTYSMENNQ